MDVETGELGNLTCKRASKCPPCAFRKGYKLSTFIHEAQPTHFVTIRHLPGDPALDLDRMQRLRRSVGNRGVDFEWAWVIEMNRFNTGTHAHCYVRTNGPIREEAWNGAASYLGIEVHIQTYRSTLGGARYALKAILGCDTPYGGPTAMAGLDDSIDRVAAFAVEAHLVRNSGRLLHASRDFWLDSGGKRTTATSLLRNVVGRFRDAAMTIVYASRYRGQIVHMLKERAARESRPGGLAARGVHQPFRAARERVRFWRLRHATRWSSRGSSRKPP
jgi:hypothetical protein